MFRGCIPKNAAVVEFCVALGISKNYTTTAPVDYVTRYGAVNRASASQLKKNGFLIMCCRVEVRHSALPHFT